VYQCQGGRTLKLTHCVNIKGHGLKPLSGSTVLEKIDLSLVHQRNMPDHSPILSDKVVLPILDSILNAQGSVLKQVQFPTKWQRRVTLRYRDFLDRFNRALIDRDLSCSRCERSMNTPLYYWNHWNGYQRSSIC